MTTLRPELDRCGVCGTESEQMLIASSSTFAGPDLDLRPAQLERSNLALYVRRCPGCGGCAPQLFALLPHVAPVVDSEEYRLQLNDPSRPDLVNLFVCWSLLAEALERVTDAAQAMLHAAWVCDDLGVDGSAFRRRALELFQAAWDRGDLVDADPAVHFAVLADIARRAGEFDMAMQFYSEGIASGPEPSVEAVLAFQRNLIGVRDREAHRVEEAEPAMGPNPPPRAQPSPRPPPQATQGVSYFVRPEYGGPLLGFIPPREVGPPDPRLVQALQ